jgi:hypothetical protein
MPKKLSEVKESVKLYIGKLDAAERRLALLTSAFDQVGLTGVSDKIHASMGDIREVSLGLSVAIGRKE